MGSLGDVLLALAGLVAVLVAPVEIGLGVVLGYWLLVPGLLSVPFLPHVVLVWRVVLWGFGLRLLLRHGLRGEPTKRAYALTAMHAAFAVVLVAWWFDGVVNTPRGFPVGSNIDNWLILLDTAIVYVVVVAVARTVGVFRVARTLVALLAVSMVIGLFEWLVGHSWGAFFFEHIPARYIAPGAGPLQSRAGSPRPTVNAQFALEYGWILVFFAGIVVVTAVRWAKVRWQRWPNIPRLAIALPFLLAVIVILCKGRSSEVALPVGLVLLTILGGGRRFLPLLGGAAVIAIAIWIFDPSFLSAAFTNADPASVRLNRLPGLFAGVTQHRWTGVSLVGVEDFGGLDNGFAYTYAQVGMIGLLAWIVVLVTAGATALSTLRAPVGSEIRRLGAACLVGIVGVVAACAVYDLTFTPESRWALSVLAALAAVAAEQIPKGQVIRRRWPLRAMLPVAGTALGFVVLAVFPAGASQHLTLEPVTANVVAKSLFPIDGFYALTVPDSICSAITTPSRIVEGTSVACDEEAVIDPIVFPAQVDVTVSGAHADQVAREVASIMTLGRTRIHFSGGPTQPIEVGKPTLAATAPLTGAVAGILGACLLPVRRRRNPSGVRLVALAPA